MSGSEGESSSLLLVPNPSSKPRRPSELRLKHQRNGIVQNKKPSPSPTRRSSQPAISTSPTEQNVTSLNGRVRLRRSSNSSSTSAAATPHQRPLSVYDTPSSPTVASSPPARHQRSTSVQPRSATDLDFHRYVRIQPGQAEAISKK